jgi:hypothetical protein
MQRSGTMYRSHTQGSSVRVGKKACTVEFLVTAMYAHQITCSIVTVEKGACVDIIFLHKITHLIAS